MAAEKRITSLRKVLAEVSDISSAQGLLSWDQETCMPKRGLQARSEVMSTLAALSHRKFTDPAVGDLLAALEGAAEGELSPEETALVREVRRDYDRSTKIPEALIKQIVETRALALPAWQEARAESEFATFAPYLQKLLDLKRQEAEAVGYQEAPLDALLDQYEAGAKESDLRRLFAGLRQELQPFVRTLLEAERTVDTGPVRRRFDERKQREFSVEVARAMGFDFESGRVDRATHPFCSGIHTGDVRLTWRSNENDLRPAFFGIVHEAGHGLYEQGLSEEWAKTPLGEAVSLGVHESQSRLWENMVARGRPFWSHFLPVLKQHFPGLLDDVDPEGMYRAVNEVSPSFIRVEADELTYNLHILLRFEIECELFRGDLSMEELPEAWNQKVSDLLGIRPESDADGVLQDIHWSMGAFGYFPTYTLGNLYAAQLFEAAERELGDLAERISRGELLPLRDWMREKIHLRGRQFQPKELIEMVTGKPPGQEAFMRYVRTKYSDIYGIS